MNTVYSSYKAHDLIILSMPKSGMVFACIKI